VRRELKGARALRAVRVVRLLGIAALAIGAGACASTAPVELESHDSNRAAPFENPPGSARRTSIAWRLPKLIARFISHGLASRTNDHSHILSHARTVEQFDALRGKNSVTWIGHMTVLLQLDGVNIVTDPWWSDRASPIPGFGPKRYAEPALGLNELPPIDIVIVSHSHRDHLDLRAIEALPKHANTTAVVPLGLGRFFSKRGYNNVVELAWEETADIHGMRITALPAIHWSKRAWFKKNDTLWASYAIEGASGTRVYFGGDSDYGPVHAEMASRWGEFDLALLSIGGFHNAGVHCAPEECVRIAMDLDARALLPLHWGTIYLGEGPPRELPARFAANAFAHGFAPDDVWQMDIGETRALPAPLHSERTPPLVAAASLAARGADADLPEAF
jgi:L-ascorbate metabolism protein UlaG (beta-lactamase superfamily)